MTLNGLDLEESLSSDSSVVRKVFSPRRTYLFAALGLTTLGLFIYYIGNISLFAAVGSAAMGDVYVFFYFRSNSWKASKYGKPNNAKGVPPIFLIVLGSPAAILLFLDLIGLGGHSLLLIVLNSIMVFGFSVTFFFATFTIPLAIFHANEERVELKIPRGYRPLVSILVPAYNEEKVLSRSLESLIRLKYEKKEIIVIDDGSKDKTAIIAGYYAHAYPNIVKVLRRPNGGKARAMNYGLLFAQGQIVAIMDADSCLAEDSLDRVVSIMSDRSIHAVCGNIEALNRDSFLTKCQALEYITSENILRTSFARPGAIGVLPGAFSAFRRKEVLEVGSYDPDNIAEDFDLTIKLHKAYSDMGKMDATSAGTAYTEVPPTLRSLYRQRMRWYIGTFQGIAKHKDVYWSKRYGLLHSIIYPTITLSLILPFVTCTSIITGVILITHGEALNFLSILFLFMSAQVFIALLAISLDRGGQGHIDGYSLAWYSIFLSIGYRQIIDCFTIASILKFLFSKKARNSLHFAKVERVGGVAPSSG
jgi:cellulose synthase/poly-beta-1,6-N-acetylglucosamine synthase-like glycosyltransferase